MSTTTARPLTACRWCTRGYSKSGGIIGMLGQCGCCNRAEPAGQLGSHYADDPKAECLHYDDPEVVAAREAKQAAARQRFEEQQAAARARDVDR